ncbi:major facilitator superfamily domain-containing protein [Hypoxylon sp. FL1150]|nr:major facilitator superfamily domain-containing protein [Hypoxylon sp. FL1150]
MFRLNWLGSLPLPILAAIKNTRSILAAMAQDTESGTDANSFPSRLDEERRPDGQQFERQVPERQVLEGQVPENGDEGDGGSAVLRNGNDTQNPGDVVDDSSHPVKPQAEVPSHDGRPSESRRRESEAVDSSHTSEQEADQADPEHSGDGTDSSSQTSKSNDEKAVVTPDTPDTPADTPPPKTLVHSSLDLLRLSLTLDRDQIRSVYHTGKLVLDIDQVRKVRSSGGIYLAREETGTLTPRANDTADDDSASTPKEDDVGDGAGNGVAPTILALTDLDKSIIGWESQTDPKMPLNFSAARKWVIVWSLAAITFMSPFSSSVLAPAIRYISRDFHNHNEILGSLPVSIYLLGYATGPLLLAPLSEIFGRAGVLTFSNVFFCVWHIGCALAPGLPFLIMFRFVSGVGGSGCMTLGGAIIGDLFPIEQRGIALSIWALGPLIGPTVGPLVGAFIAGSIGWRWAFWIVLIPSAVTTIILAIFLPETNHKVLMQRKTKRMMKELNRTDLKTCYEAQEGRKVSQLAILRIGMLRPLKMLIFAPMICIQSLYVSFIYGSVYLMYNSIPPTFDHRYGWATGMSGLVFLSIGLGYMGGLWAFSMLSDRTVVRLTKANKGVFKPEFRLTIMIWYSFLCPLAFFWYGWSVQLRAHWIVPILGLFPLGFGVIGVFMPTQAYIIDAYPSYAASGIAAFTVLRSVIAAFLPLCGSVLYKNLGNGWGNSVLGFIGVVMIPVPIFIYKFGARLREKYPLKL